jgi:uncharacterized membrane protein YbaN (DUF454 family)
MDDIHFLTLGSILLTIGIIGFLSGNALLSVLTLALALACFVRQYIKNINRKEKEQIDGN